MPGCVKCRRRPTSRDTGLCPDCEPKVKPTSAGTTSSASKKAAKKSG